MNIVFEPLPDTEALNPIKERWFAAAHKSELPDPCASEPPWALSYHFSIRKNRPVLLLLEHGNAVCFAEEQQGGQTLLVPLESSWLYDRPILGEDPLPLFFSALECIEQYYIHRPFPFIVVGGMWPHHQFANELILNLSHTFAFHRITQYTQCSASLEGGVATFLSNRSANFRQKLKKARRVAKDAGISFERHAPSSREEAKNIYTRMLAVEGTSWKGKEGDGLYHPYSRPFYDRLLSELALMGSARVIFAQKEERDIGFIFGGLSNGIYRGQQFSYDLSYARYSIGNILQFEQILWLSEEDCYRYDMGPITGPKMEYKSHWTENTYPLECWLLSHT